MNLKSYLWIIKESKLLFEYTLCFNQNSDSTMKNFDLINSASVVYLGIPYDDSSSFMKGPAKAPDKIREALYSGSSNLTAENGIDFEKDKILLDLGNIELVGDTLEKFGNITKNILNVVETEIPLISLGGDHSITFPVVQAFAEKYNRLTIIQLDAHPDLYDELDGNRLSHACQFARIMENNLCRRLIQVGIRGFTKHQREQAKKFDIKSFEMLPGIPVPKLDFQIDGPVYLSLDLDVLDPAFAPGVSHHEPGGMSVRELLNFIHNLDADIVGADIVEFNPDRDKSGITAMVGAKLLKEIASLMI